MQRMWLSWPTLVAVGLFFLNVDLIVMPTLVVCGIHGVALFVLVTLAATGEANYWYWYVGWLSEHARTSAPAVRIAHEFRGTGLLQQITVTWVRMRALARDIWEWFVDHVHKQIQGSGRIKQKMLNCALAVIRSSPRWMSYFVMAALGCMPLGWIPGILVGRKIQQSRRAPGAFAIFCLCNALKTYAYGVGLLQGLTWVGFFGG